MFIIKILLTVTHVFICILLVIVILLQSSKGGGLSGTFGGQASTAIFGARGTTTVLTRATQYLATAFLLLSLMLSLIAGHGLVTQSVTEKVLENAPAAALPSAEDVKSSLNAVAGAASGEGTAQPSTGAEGETQDAG